MRLSAWPVVFVITFSGCVRDEFHLELVPEKNSVERTLTIRRDSSKSLKDIDEDAKRLAKEYKAGIPTPSAHQTFEGRFAGRMPNDVGGYGTFTRWETPLGSVTAYVERFRGDDDTAGLLQRREVAARRLADILADWLKSELKNEPGWPALQTFLEHKFPRDLTNVTLYAWSLRLFDRPEEAAEPVVNLLQYLLERDYLTPDEIPAIRRAFEDANREDYGRLLEWCRRLIVTRMGKDLDPSPRLEFLASKDRLQDSLRTYLATTDEYGLLTHAWLEKRKSDPKAEKPDPFEVLGSLVGQMFPGMIQLGGDRLGITLRTEHPPIYTNGDWSAETGTIRWQNRFLPVEQMPPQTAYAIWDEPDEVAQTAAFGETALRGKTLLDYCLWYRGLTDHERTEWDAFLETFPTGEKPDETLQNFRFRDEPDGGDRDRRIAKPAVEAILQGLTPEAK